MGFSGAEKECATFVTLLYPEFGIGKVRNVYLKNSYWYCQVTFDQGIMDANQDEFIPA